MYICIYAHMGPNGNEMFHKNLFLETLGIMIKVVPHNPQTLCFNKKNITIFQTFLWFTLPETNSTPLKIRHPKKERIVSQAPIFKGELLVKGRVLSLWVFFFLVAKKIPFYTRRTNNFRETKKIYNICSTKNLSTSAPRTFSWVETCTFSAEAVGHPMVGWWIWWAE